MRRQITLHELFLYECGYYEDVDGEIKCITEKDLKENNLFRDENDEIKPIEELDMSKHEMSCKAATKAKGMKKEKEMPKKKKK